MSFATAIVHNLRPLLLVTQTAVLLVGSRGYLVALAVWVVAVDSNSWAMVAVILIALCCLLGANISSALAGFRLSDATRTFIAALGPVTFERVPIESCAKAIHGAANLGADKTNDRKPEDDATRDLVEALSPWLLRHKGDYLSVFVVRVADGAGDLPTSQKTFQNVGALHCDIYVTDHPQEMSGLQLFQLLHEFGHAQLAGGQHLTTPSLLAPSLSVVVLASLIAWSPYALMFLGCVVVLEVCLFVLAKRDFATAALLDELAADRWAFTHAAKQWFAAYDSTRLAQMFCYHDDGDTRTEGRNWISQKTIQSLRTLRQEQFRRNVDALREGLDPVELEPPTAKYVWWLQQSLIYTKAGIVCVVVYQFGEYSPWALGSLLILGLVLSLGFAVVNKLGIDYAARRHDWSRGPESARLRCF